LKLLNTMDSITTTFTFVEIVPLKKTSTSHTEQKFLAMIQRKTRISIQTTPSFVQIVGVLFPKSTINGQQKQKKRFVGMHDLADSLATEALGRFIIAPGLTINFHGLTQLSKVAFIPNSTVGFSVNFLDKKNPIGVFNCGFGSFSSIAYNKISFAGTELKIYDTFLAVNEFSASPKSLLVSGSIFSLGVGGNGNNPIVFANSTETSITSSYFTSDFPNDVGFVAINLKMRDNNWFGTSVRFYGQTKQIDLSNEFGYTF